MLKAIETVYNGYRFRSRLEARWAVFFDTLGIRYEYEKEGYDLDGTWYLPDFWLPVPEMWVEVKAELPEHTTMYADLARQSGYPVLMAWGTPNGDAPINGARLYFPNGMATLSAQWNAFGIAYTGCFTCLWQNPIKSSIENAALAAKQARFEHGEHGAPQQPRRRVVPTIARADNFPQSPCPICGKPTCTTAHNIRLDLRTYRRHECAAGA